MKQFKKILALMLIVSLGTVVACGDDDDKSKNNANSQTDTGLVEGDTDNTGGDDTDNTGGDDTDNTGGDDTGTGEGDEKQLKDLNADELSALCARTIAQESVLTDVTTDLGKANCLVSGALTGYYESEDEAEILEVCEFVADDCIENPEDAPVECLDSTSGCTATVAEFDKCTLDYIAAEKAFLANFTGKTCQDFSSEDGMDAMDAAFEAYTELASCELLNTKCPNLFGAE